jgi:hypothetical protein
VDVEDVVVVFMVEVEAEELSVELFKREAIEFLIKAFSSAEESGVGKAMLAGATPFGADEVGEVEVEVDVAEALPVTLGSGFFRFFLSPPDSFGICPA